MNTCTVTAGADQDARAAIRRVRRQNPTAQIVVTGCYAQRAPEEIAALPGVGVVVGNSHKHQLAEIMSAERADLGLRSPDLNFVPVTSLAGTRESATTILQYQPSFRSEQSEVEGPGSEVQGPRSEVHTFVSDIFAHTELLAAPVFDAANERTRPILQVQDGCDNRCSFCVIPFVRGQSRSLGIDRILREVNGLVNSGYREVVISGINLGRWGRDLDFGPQTPDLRQDVAAALGGPKSEGRLENLIRAILAETALEKLRISSVEPMDWTDELISLVACSPRIAKHAHVPMQSGSDAVLRRMHRKYRPWHYREKIEKIRTAISTAAIGADVMVGFPGETDAEFEATRRMIEDLPLTYLHVFTYSARPGTAAAAMENQVSVQLARERNRVLRELATEKKSSFMRSFVGQTLEAITLNVVTHNGSGEFTEALTDNYLKLRLRGRHEPNRWLPAQIDDVVQGALSGVEAAAH